MATAASTAEAGILLVDARKGVLEQTRRHSRIARLLGIRKVALAVNKMDLIGWSETRFREIEAAYLSFARSIGLEELTAIPVSALEGVNIVAAAAADAPWYRGPTLLEWLETVPLPDEGDDIPFAMPVQWVNRPSADFRGFSGRIAAGRVTVGDRIRVAPSGQTSTVSKILDGSGVRRGAAAGQSVTLVLTDEIDVSRGDVLAAEADPVAHSDQFEADVIWMNEKPLLPGRSYLIQIHRKLAGLSVGAIKYRVDINAGTHLAAKTLNLNEIGVVTISVDRPVPFAAYDRSRMLGGFIIIDRITNETIGAGMIRYALRRAENIRWQAIDVTKQARAALKLQTPRCLWFTGLSGSGKSTIANLVEKRLLADGRHTYILDGDNIRHGLNRDLGFTDVARVENIRRVAEVARLMVDAGLIVLVAFISPFRGERHMARALFEEGEFLEIFVDAPLAACEARDVKGLYAKARRGELKNFTGIDSAYQPPLNPDLHIQTARITSEEAVDLILEKLNSPAHI
jgi:bifunctional enzyme CysN/CysC